MRCATSRREVCAGVLFSASLVPAPERALAASQVAVDESHDRTTVAIA